ncbi:predicted protein [Sclerotinia sclerotiorum 1980 UF-70]|uniref:Uncharacterized protein n=1 Tax=Sclerotinia sclerotiorum (strain ATCC 18683 / 1980 / Ss-1) TaxID=665079 RepID=A7EK50_SCLS1|nr:predicted protein [Sclerotinia sclerotiorum 1980 UF-70]EDO03216.1 predicted protein [Sclerotinia sclerotiorum 1980 UF-70]
MSIQDPFNGPTRLFQGRNESISSPSIHPSLFFLVPGVPPFGLTGTLHEDHM